MIERRDATAPLEKAGEIKGGGDQHIGRVFDDKHRTARGGTRHSRRGPDAVVGGSDDEMATTRTYSRLATFVVFRTVLAHSCAVREAAPLWEASREGRRTADRLTGYARRTRGKRIARVATDRHGLDGRRLWRYSPLAAKIRRPTGRSHPARLGRPDAQNQSPTAGQYRYRLG